MKYYWLSEAETFEINEKLEKINGKLYVKNFEVLFEDANNRGKFYYKKENSDGSIEMLEYDPKVMENIDEDAIGNWGYTRYQYLEEENPKLFLEFAISGELEQYLIEFEEQMIQYKKDEIKHFKEITSEDDPDYERKLNELRRDISSTINRIYIPDDEVYEPIIRPEDRPKTLLEIISDIRNRVDDEDDEEEQWEILI